MFIAVAAHSPLLVDIEGVIVYACRRLGHRVTQYDHSKSSFDIAKMLRLVNEADIIFVPVHALLRHPSVHTQSFIERLNAGKARVVLTVVDEPRILSRMHNIVLRYYKRMVWPHTNGYLNLYGKCEKIISEPLIGESYCYEKLIGSSKQFDVIFNGALYSFRHRFLQALISSLPSEVTLKILSRYDAQLGVPAQYWMGRVKEVRPHEKVNRIYNQARILLVFGSYADATVEYSKEELTNLVAVSQRSGGYPCRLLSYLGSGSFVLADKRTEQERYFTDGVEAVTYNSVGECAEKILYYLKHEQEREQIATAGQRRYLEDHKPEVRMQRVLQTIIGA